MSDAALLTSTDTYRPRRLARTDAERCAAMDRLTLLKNLSFGSQVAEEEIQDLGKYFVQTDQWARIIDGHTDIVRGEKGAGKSALYLLLNQKETELADKKIIVCNAENPKGSTVFKDLVADPPASEAEFIILWKIYTIVLVMDQINKRGLRHKSFGPALTALQEAGLIEAQLNLSGLLRSAQILARRLLSQTKLEAGVELNENTGAPSGIIGRLSLREPSGELKGKGINSLDGYMHDVNSGLKDLGWSAWVLLDRLDVAFAESHNLEANAIRALLRVYRDLSSMDCLCPKIFLREDIWKRVTEGMREASHIVRFQIVDWSQETLLNLILRRILNNDVIISEYRLDRRAILASADQQGSIFGKLFPKQVERGPQKAPTLKWLITRCADGKGKTAPREMIHLLNSIKAQEIRRLENGGAISPEGFLFDRSVFKAALPEVSKSRLNTYIYAEYPKERPFISSLEGRRTEQTPGSLQKYWGVSRPDALAKAKELVELGFFERRGSFDAPTFWVPFLYRDALSLTQGKEDIA